MALMQSRAAGLPQHIKVDLKGSLSHAEVMEYYKEHGVHAFISLSESEGLPVSMMEAISFGIPVISTDVGGVRELVNEYTGLLIDADPEPEVIAQHIDDCLLTGLQSASFRAGVRNSWQEKFASAKNYPRLIAELKKLYAQ